ncbi:MAG: aspartyl/asparaginyl beta-hydroxylase domain-containing protein [Sphingomicrobium sp.]
MARGDVRQAASLLELAAQRGRDASTLLRLATVRRSVGDLSGAMQAATAAVELAPRNFLMALMLGSLREASGACHAAERAYRSACDHAPLDLAFQPAIQRQLIHAREQTARFRGWRTRLLEWQPDGPFAKLTATEERRLRQFRSNILDNFDSGPLSRPVFMVPGIRPKRFFDPDELAGIAEVERATDAIRTEFLALADNRSDFAARLRGLHSSERGSTQSGNWSMIPLIKNGIVGEFAAACPTTMEVARGLDLPALGLISPSLYFSVLEPNSRIAPHTGLTNARLIAHFPLIVPGDCGLRVGNETRRWAPGKALVFDDMTLHEAWNDSDRIRVVLIADLWRPELTSLERLGIEAMMDV